MDRKSLDVACSSHILVSITFHFSPGRLGFLADVVRSLISFSCTCVDVVIFTNTSKNTEIRLINSVLKSVGAAAKIAVAHDLRDPFELTWVHKALIRQWHDDYSSKTTHFIYIEDDERLGFDNFIYWLEARRLLRSHDLLPGFVRTEWSSHAKKLVSADSLAPISLDDRRFVSYASRAYMNLDNPYCGSFILDREAAAEYVASRSFDPVQSASVMEWEIRERAAAGLTWERIPAGFKSRVVVPIDPATNILDPRSYIAHLPNTYANNPHVPFGEIALHELFKGSLKESNAIAPVPDLVP